MMEGTSRAPAKQPSVNRPLFWLFSRYNDWYLRRHFHAIRRWKGEEVPRDFEGPPVFYMNHPGWWDPLIGLKLINRYWNDRDHFVAVAEEQMDRYRFFRWLGGFPVPLNTPSAGPRFFRTVDRMFSEGAENALWMAPQGRLADPRRRPLRFRPGLGHLASRLDSGTLVPVAVQYSFWSDRFPEALFGIGEPVSIRGTDRSPDGWTALLEDRLLAVLDPMLEADRDRKQEAFEVIVEGSEDVGGVYGLWLSFLNLFGTRLPTGTGERPEDHES